MPPAHPPSRQKGRGARRAVTGARAMVLVAAALASSCETPASPRPAQSGPPPKPVHAHAVVYAMGRAYLSWRAGDGAPSDDFMVTAIGPGRPPAPRLVAGTDAVVAGLTVGRAYRFTIAAANSSGDSQAARTNMVTAVGRRPPAAPAHVVLRASHQDNEVAITWSPPKKAPAPESYTIEVFEGTRTKRQPVGAVTREAPCAAKTIEADPGTTVGAEVTAANEVGRSAPATGDEVTSSHPCPLACLVIDATAPGPIEDHPGSGLLHGVGSRTSTALVAALHPQFWREAVSHFASPANPFGEDAIAAHVAAKAGTDTSPKLTELLSDDWRTLHKIPVGQPDAGYAVEPWLDLPAYQVWVAEEVRGLEAAGRAAGISIAYWDVQNEPFSGAYYSPGPDPARPVSQGGVGETVADVEAQWLAAYRGIKAVDPGAQVLSPSLGAWSADSAQAQAEQPGSIDMRTFLDFAVLHDAPPDAIAWHRSDPR